MIILALDAALSSCSAAVLRDGEPVREIFEDRLRGHAERLVPMCQRACAAAAVSFDQITHIAVTRGPGTFTGVRIGLAAAKGLALALDVPLLGVTTLEVVARNAQTQMGRDPGRVAIVHDARRAEVYMQLFDLASDGPAALTPPAAVPLDQVEKILRDAGVSALVGSGARLVADLLSPEVAADMTFPEVPDQPNAATVSRLARERIMAGEIEPAVTPLYLRAPDAIAATPISYPFQNQ